MHVRDTRFKYKKNMYMDVKVREFYNIVLTVKDNSKHTYHNLTLYNSYVKARMKQ